MIEKRQKVILYTDGACLGNPGPGGYGVVVLCDNQRNEYSGGYRRTTNNRMEIMAAIVGLSELNAPSDVTLYSDSRYLVDAITKGWVRSWKSRGWKRSTGEKALNVDLWKRLIELNERHKVTYQWVAGHAGVKENERCDQLSVAAAKSKNLPVDSGYENPASQGGLF